MKIAIAGASGNLGILLSRYLVEFPYHLTLFTHKRVLPHDLTSRKNVEVTRVDLNDPNTLTGRCQGIDCVISLAGVLFRGAPEKFLSITNTRYVENLAAEAARSGVRKFLLFSFPHVEGDTYLDVPAKGILPEKDPEPIHARTRLAAERSLARICAASDMRYLILRIGVVYGREVKLIQYAHTLMRRRMLFIWRNPTWIHLIVLPDLLTIVKLCIEQSSFDGILNVADDQPLLLREFVNRLATHWNVPKPHSLPRRCFTMAAQMFDLASRILKCPVPLNPDILRMGMMSSVCDTSRLKNELGYRLKYATLEDGIDLC